MGLFSKLFGKKKEEELALEEPLPKEPLGLEEKPSLPETPSPELPPHLAEPAPSSVPSQPPGISPRDIELLNSKLDTLKAILNSMDQRLANLEKAAGIEQKKMPW